MKEFIEEELLKNGYNHNSLGSNLELALGNLPNNVRVVIRSIIKYMDLCNQPPEPKEE